MRFILNRVLIAFIFTALAVPVAFAKGGRATVPFATDTNVNGTMVKKGTYDVKFDEASGVLLILKNGKEIAKANARLEKRDQKARNFEFRTTTEGAERKLVGVTFSGSDQEVVLS